MKGRKMKLKVALLAMVAFGGAATAVYAADRLEPTRVSALLKARLPKTQVSAIDCDKVAGLCEVVAGKTLFYVDGSARYLIVGRVYDMETRQDLTAAKLLALGAHDLEIVAPTLETAFTTLTQDAGE